MADQLESEGEKMAMALNKPATIKELLLSGQTLPSDTKNLDDLQRVGLKLFKDNEEHIKREIPDNYFVIIEPVSGWLLADVDPAELYEYAKAKFQNRLFFVVGILDKHSTCKALISN